MKFLIWQLCLVMLSLSPAAAQRISYSEPQRDDTKRTSFDIVGKVGERILIHKVNRNDNLLSVYDQNMKLIRTVQLNQGGSRWINVDFVPYPNHTWMIYQYQQKGIVYCMGVKLDSEGNMLSKPLELDTTRIGGSSDNKIYTTVYSDNKEHIMVFKINSRNQRNFVFTTLLHDSTLHRRNKHQLSLPMEERNDYFTDFLLDNQGGLVFGKFLRKSGGDFVTDLRLIHKPADTPGFAIHDLKTSDMVLDEVKIKIDNSNNRYLFSAFYYKQKRGNIEGLFTVTWDIATASIFREHTMPFTEELRAQARRQDGNTRTAFNDYFIKNIIIRKDGGYILITESMYTTSRGGGAFNRWNYMGWNNPWISPFSSYYYSPFYYNSFGMPWRYGYGYAGQGTRFHAENIMIFSFSREDSLEWSNVIPKSQFDDQSDALLSHQVMNTGGELHFLFNQYERRTLLLNDQSIGGDGRLVRHPTLKNLDRNIEFMPKYGKQVSARSMIIPCQFRNYLIFAKIDF